MTGRGCRRWSLPLACFPLLLAGVSPGAVAGQRPGPNGRARRALQAQRTEVPPVLDGRLDEAEWTAAAPVGEFVQSEPFEGEPLTERTLVRVLYDRDNLYVGVHCYDSRPDRIVVNELVRDFDSKEGDAFGISIDPFLDRRSSFTFFVNPGGAQRDSQAFADGRDVNLQWDGVWLAAAVVGSDGWSAEISIPWKTLGVRSAAVGTMGINFKRRIRRKNEEGYWSFVPRRFTISYMSNEGELTGLGQVATGGNLRLKPFVTGDARFGDAPAAADAFSPKVGADLKYRVGEGMTLDVTYNTDFSQVEVDQEQINLTRFSLFFPEKRDFFLENAGIFTLGDVPNQRSSNNRNEETQLFYTRRLGLSRSGQPLPLAGGVRLSGRSGPYSLGVMNIHQKSTSGLESNNFSVARVRRNLLAHSDLGAMAAYRKGGRDGDYNLSYGGDFNTRVLDRLTLNAYAAATRTPGVSAASHAVQLAAGWEDRLFQGLLIAADMGEGFDPQMGFVPRAGVRNYQANFGMTPRPRGWPLLRQLRPHTNIKIFNDRHGLALSRDEHYALELSFHDGGRIEVSANPQFERLRAPFRLPNGVTIPAGDYDFGEFRLQYSSDKSRLVAGTLNLIHGGYYDGRRTRIAPSANLLLKPRLLATLSYEHNRVRVPAGSYRADLLSLRTIYSFSPNLFADAYVQRNTSTGITLSNVRFSWTYRPLSSLIVVFNDTRAADRSASWRAIVVKATRLLQF